jgi:Ni,Fe-hydrogenase III large subunit
MIGARQGALAGFRRVIAGAMARDLRGFVVPGVDVARAAGLDLESGGLRLSATPRHASVLIVIAPLPTGLAKAASVAYAQMPRPRTILALGAGDLAPLPDADATGPLTQDGLVNAIADLRRVIATGAYKSEVHDYEAPALQVRIEYTCPMHPEVVSDAPGNCPKCGMDLVPRETDAAPHSGHSMPEMEHGMSAETPVKTPVKKPVKTPVKTPAKTMAASHNTDLQTTAKTTTQYTCPMHPEVLSDEPGSCPKCGMHLVPVEASAKGGHADHSGHQHSHGKGHGMAGDKTDAKAAQYTCPMHPEVLSDEPGSCPKCGMHLVPVEASTKSDHADHSGHQHSHGKGHGMADDKTDDMAAQFTCPMHPEVLSDEPGSCPKCGMHLVPVEASAKGDHADHSGHQHSHGKGHGMVDDKTDAKAGQYTCPMHPEVLSDEPGSCPKCGMHLVPVEASAKGGHADHSGHQHSHGKGHGMADAKTDAKAAQYTCPMHPEVLSDEPGSCPKCGMFLVPVEASEDRGQGDHSAHKTHGGEGMVAGIEPQFMSMVGLTKDQPRSSDGLQMDWIPVAFGPFFTGLPGGLDLELMLDGDSVAGAKIGSLVAAQSPLVTAPQDASEFVAGLAKSMPLAPVSYQLLACLAVEDAAGLQQDDASKRAAVAALERERIASHLSDLSQMGAQAGFGWLTSRAADFQLKLQAADAGAIAGITPALLAFLNRLRSTPMLRARLKNIAPIGPDAAVTGPVARARSSGVDLRSSDPTYLALGFVAAFKDGGDAFARFLVRCDEIAHSLQLIAAVGDISVPELAEIGAASGEGSGRVETPRGMARLSVRLEKGQVVGADLETPSMLHAELIEDLTAQQELGDALVAVASLDISPWEMSEGLLGGMTS